MCLIAFAWGASERFPFVIAANRDEFLERPTQALSLWQSSGGATVLGGRDLQGGGIWMGFAANGRFAMLTNVRQPKAIPPEHVISRGSLALSWLESQLDASDWADTLQPLRYQGFNLIAGDARQQTCFYLSNQNYSKDFKPFPDAEYEKLAIKIVAKKMKPGHIYGLSNAALDTPWPKTLQLKTALANSLATASELEVREQCLAALANPQQVPDAELPDTGVPIELERSLSSVFVSHPQPLPRYGTRSSLVAICDASGQMSVTEVTHSHNTNPAQTQYAQMRWV